MVHFVWEVELLQDQKMLQSQENSVSQKQKWASVTGIRRKQWLMSFACENHSFAGPVWREGAWWRNAERVEKQLEARDKNKLQNRIQCIWFVKLTDLTHRNLCVFWWCQNRSRPENMKSERERRRWLQHFWDPEARKANALMKLFRKGSSTKKRERKKELPKKWISIREISSEFIPFVWVSCSQHDLKKHQCSYTSTTAETQSLSFPCSSVQWFAEPYISGHKVKAETPASYQSSCSLCFYVVLSVALPSVWWVTEWLFFQEKIEISA